MNKRRNDLAEFVGPPPYRPMGWSLQQAATRKKMSLQKAAAIASGFQLSALTGLMFALGVPIAYVAASWSTWLLCLGLAHSIGHRIR